MAKRMMTRFDQGRFPTFDRVEENGYPQPCVMGHPWVNPITLKTIRKRGGSATDPWGRPLDAEQQPTGSAERGAKPFVDRGTAEREPGIR